MKYTLWSLMRFAFVAYVLAGAIVIGPLAVTAVLLSVAFVLEDWREHPFKAVASSVIMLGIGIVMLLVVRLMWRAAWETIAEIQKEPPSWGKPPPWPIPSAPVPNLPSTACGE